MIRFENFEALGLRVAAMSDRSDGDCRIDGLGGASSRHEFCMRCGVDPGQLVLGKQTHGVRVATVGIADRGRGADGTVPPVPDTDALITADEGVPLAILIADCVPLYLFARQPRAIGVAHAGRVGTLSNIAGATIARMIDEFGVDPSEIYALIGPSAGPNAYEVSESMAEEFRAAGLAASGRFLDLWESNLSQIETAGVPHSQISVARVCTITDGRFFSHRAHADGRRNMALIMM